MRKILLALLAAPGAAAAQVYPSQEPPITLDPGAAPQPAPAAPQPVRPQEPNVIVVGPDGKVTYGPGTGQDQGQPQGGYYYDPEGGLYDEPDMGAPVAVHTGPTPEVHVVRRGDTLWDISFYYFNDPWQWPKIWSYNPQITNPHWIYPGDLVRLLPRGMFAAQAGVEEPEAEGTAAAEAPKQVERLPAPSQRSIAGIKQTAFVEKAELDRSIKIDGSVDEKELLAIGDSVYLSYPEKNPPKVGQRYSIYAPEQTVKHGGKEHGAYVRVLGTVEVVSVPQGKKARGVIVEANQEIERGSRVGPLAKQWKNVAPVPPKVNAQGTIVAMLAADQLIGQGEIVFIDLGKKSGIEVGNRMFVVRRGDALPPQVKDLAGQDDRRFPARSLGQIVIVEVGEKISVGLVTLSVQEASVGDLVMMQKSP